MTLEEWLDRRTIPGLGGCRIWTGRVLNSGYGDASYRRRRTTAHRTALLRSGRDVPPSMHVDHLCRNKLCINPAHLDVVTCAVNVQRGDRTTLSREEVASLKSRYLAAGCPRGFASREARRLGVTPRSVQLILKGDRWANVGAAA